MDKITTINEKENLSEGISKKDNSGHNPASQNDDLEKSQKQDNSNNEER